MLVVVAAAAVVEVDEEVVSNRKHLKLLFFRNPWCLNLRISMLVFKWATKPKLIVASNIFVLIYVNIEYWV